MTGQGALGLGLGIGMLLAGFLATSAAAPQSGPAILIQQPTARLIRRQETRGA
jgi:hypothetical protein